MLLKQGFQESPEEQIQEGRKLYIGDSEADVKVLLTLMLWDADI